MPLIELLPRAALCTVLFTLAACNGLGEDSSASDAAPSNSAAASSAAAVVAMSSPTYALAPSATTAAVTVNRSGDSKGVATVNYATVNGSASAGVEYSATSGSLTWADGDASPKVILVSINSSASGKKFDVALNSVAGAASLGSPSSATVQFASAPISGSTTARAGETLSGDTSRSNNSTFVLGEPVQLTFTISGASASQSYVLTLNVIDETGSAISSIPVSLTTNSSGGATTTVAAPASKMGYYRVNAELSDGTTLTMLGTRPGGFITYAVVPDPASRVNYGDALSHFGMEGGFSTAQGDIIPFLGLRYMLTSAGAWAGQEAKNAGQFAVAKAAAKAAGLVFPAKAPVTDAVSYNGSAWPTFSVPQIAGASIPNWAGPIAGTGGTWCKQFGALNAAGVAGLPGYASALATEVAEDYATQSTHYYQVTWEPESPWCFGGTAAQLVQYYQLVYPAIHAADPKALVMGPALFPQDDSHQTAALYAAGLGKYIDAFAIHPYVNSSPEEAGLVQSIRSEMAAATAAVGHSIPFVATEYGFTSGAFGELGEALNDVRESIILIGEGFKYAVTFYPADYWDNNSTETKNTYGYYWNLNPNMDWGPDKIGPKPAVPAYAAMTYMLDGTTTSGPIANLTGTQMGYRFKRDGKTILAVWDYKATSSTVTLPTPAGSVEVCTWMGNCTTTTSDGNLSLTLGAAPIYIVGQNL